MAASIALAMATASYLAAARNRSKGMPAAERALFKKASRFFLRASSCERSSSSMAKRMSVEP